MHRVERNHRGLTPWVVLPFDTPGGFRRLPGASFQVEPGCT
jgi:hypothetical protein